MILYAVFDRLHSQRAVISAFGALLLMLVMWVVNRSPGRDWIAILLATPVLTLLLIFIVNNDLVVWSALLEGLLYFYAAGSLIVIYATMTI